MVAIVRNARFWLVMQMFAAVVLGSAFGLIHVESVPDTPGYLQGTELSFVELLSYYRTIGYPYFLRLIEMFSPGFALAPWIHLGLLFACVWLLDSVTRRFGANTWEAFAISSGFFWAALDTRCLNYLATDFLGVVGAGATIAMVFWTVSTPRRILPWLGLALILAVTYHIRPAYLFLVAFVPCLGLLFYRLQTLHKRHRSGWLKMGAALGIASVGPYLTWCLLRLAVVGHFGLVSFGGYSLVGFAVEMLDQQTVEIELPEHLQPLARQIIEQRQRRGYETIFRGGPIVDMRHWELTYNENVHRIAAPLAAATCDNDQVLLNQQLNEFSRTIIGQHKAQYLLLVGYNFLRAGAKLPYRSLVVQILLGVVLILAVARMLQRRFRRAGAAKILSADNHHVLIAVSCLAVSYFVANMALVVLVVPAGTRYVLAAGVFVPPLLALCLRRQSIQLWRGRKPEESLPSTNAC